MDEALAKIRPHTSSSLPHQKTPATLLVAIEDTFREQNTEPSPTAYFAALLTTLDGSLQRKESSAEEGAVLPAELYLLALVAPYVSKPIIRTHLSTLLNLTAPLFPHLELHAPSLRSQLSIYHVIFLALDKSQIDTLGIRQAFASVLNLCLDPRPKVRKKAADVVKDTLANPPNPLVRHPYADRVTEWVKAALTDAAALPFSKGKSKQNSAGTDTAIHLLAFLRPVLPYLPPASLPSITSLLLTLPRLGSPYLSQSSYSILSDLFALPDDDDERNIVDQLPEVIRVILSSPPSKSDATTAPAWVRVLGDVMKLYKVVDATACAKETNKIWKAVWNFLDCNDAVTRKAAAHSLSTLAHCFSPSLISSAISEPQGSSTLSKIITQVTKALDNIAYARSIPELLSVVSALIIGLKTRQSKTSPTAAETLLLPLISQIGDLRTQKGFEYKEAADATLTVAMQILGPEVLLRALPLNLEPEQRKAGNEPRAFLLPLLNQTHPSPLGHFISYFVPLSEKMFDLQQTAEAEGRQSEAKVWSVLVGQVWSGLAGYCHTPSDLKESLTPAFAQLLSQLLYSQNELRPAILRALKVLVESHQISESTPIPENITVEEVARNMEILRTQAESWLAVLFNVFGSVNSDSKGMVGDVIAGWASIANDQTIKQAYSKVIGLFKANLANAQHAPNTANSSSESGSATAMTQDILVIVLPYLQQAEAKSLFEICLTPDVLSGRDNGVQKRGYKILAKLMESEKVNVGIIVMLKQLDTLIEGLTPAAKKDRFNLLTAIMPRLPSSELHVIPSIIPEAILGTKEPSEKARGAAFDVILAMAKKMCEGGLVKRNLIDGMDEDAPQDEAAANIEEFMTMVAGGLAGASPHMISATVTALARLVFEFKDKISVKMHTEILQTLLVFLGSANREIVKSVLGFVKLAIHTLPTDLLRPHLSELVPALLKWSHDHKNHFKVKVRHIFERMLRRFSFDEVNKYAGNDEAGKVLLNIKKRKERAKRKKASREEGEEDEEDNGQKKVTTGDAFEDVLYGSESELEDSDEDEGPIASGPGKQGKKRVMEQGARLRLDDDEPMDLLQGAAGHVTREELVSDAKSNRRRKQDDATQFKTDENTGKMVIDDNEAENEGNGGGGDDVAGKAYKESMTSVDGFTRGPNGRVKFNKDTKKRRRENEDEDDVEMADGENISAGRKKIKKKEKNEPRLGHEFKAKRAGGDIKKNGVDPFAYLSLGDAAKRGKSNKRIGIASKR